MIAHCTTSKEITWVLETVRAEYVAAKDAHVIYMIWKFTLNCPGVCSPGERCIASGKTGKTTLYYDMVKSRNRNLSPEKKAYLKACYKQSRAGFLDCAKKRRIGAWSLIDGSYLKKEPTLSPGSCRCIGENRARSDYLVTNKPFSHSDFKRDQKIEEDFWKQFIMSGPDPVPW
tara:strand:- start:6 stop:524 length:519 start_codon:yes stop_codon:yes gene_type:complete